MALKLNTVLCVACGLLLWLPSSILTFTSIVPCVTNANLVFAVLAILLQAGFLLGISLLGANFVKSCRNTCANLIVIVTVVQLFAANYHFGLTHAGYYGASYTCQVEAAITGSLYLFIALFDLMMILVIGGHQAGLAEVFGGIASTFERAADEARALALEEDVNEEEKETV